jgi:hypothetical protein
MRLEIEVAQLLRPFPERGRSERDRELRIQKIKQRKQYSPLSGIHALKRLSDAKQTHHYSAVPLFNPGNQIRLSSPALTTLAQASDGPISPWYGR